jgi:hypothetical protein
MRISNRLEIRRALAISLYLTYDPDGLIDNTLEEIEELLREVALEIRACQPWQDAIVLLTRSDNQVAVPVDLLPEVNILSSIEFIAVNGVPPTSNTGNSRTSTVHTTTTPAGFGNHKPRPDPVQTSAPQSDLAPNPLISSSHTGRSTENAADESSTRTLRPKVNHDFSKTQSVNPRKKRIGAQKSSQATTQSSNQSENPKTNAGTGAEQSASPALEEDEQDDDEEMETEPEVDDCNDDMAEDGRIVQGDSDDEDSEMEGLGNEGLLEPDLSEDSGQNENTRIETEAQAQSLDMDNGVPESRNDSDLNYCSVNKGTKRRKIQIDDECISTQRAREYISKDICTFASRRKKRDNNRKYWRIVVPVANAPEVAVRETLMAKWEFYLGLELTSDDTKVIMMLAAVELMQMVARLKR